MRGIPSDIASGSLPGRYTRDTHQVQAPLGTPLVGLSFPNLNNFREFDQNTRTVLTFPLDQMATGNPTENFPPVVNLVADMAGSSAAAQQPMPTVAKQSMAMAA